MNIALFTDSYPPMHNGVAHSVSLLKKGLTERGHSVSVVRPDIPRCTEVSNLTFFSTGCPFLPEMRVAYPIKTSIYKNLKEFKPDVIHTHTEFNIGRIGHYCAKSLGIPHIHTYHTLYEDYTHYVKPRFLAQNLLKAAARSFSAGFCGKANAVVVPTQKIRYLLGSYGTSVPIYVVPTGIDLKCFQIDENKNISSRIRKKYAIPENDRILLFVGRIAEEKSILELLDLFDAYCRFHSDCTLLIVGAGKDLKSTIDYAGNLNSALKIKFAKMQKYDNIPHFYKAADVFVSASESETQGLTYIEALASSKSVLAKRDECLDNVVIDGKNGFLFDNQKDFCKKLDLLLSDRKSSFEKSAYESSLEFSYQKYAENVENIYKKTVYAN